MQDFRLDFYHYGSAGHHDVTFLYHALQLHRAAGQRGKGQCGRAIQLEHGEVVEAPQSVAILVPPDVGGAAVTDDHDLIGAPAGLADDALIRQPHLYPALDCAGHILVPQVGLLVAANALAKYQRVVRIQRKGEQAHHHALVGFRGMPGQRQRVFGVVMAAHVGDLERSFEDGCLDCHLCIVAARILQPCIVAAAWILPDGITQPFRL